jgi:xanthine dehydrogenase accessory factor
MSDWRASAKAAHAAGPAALVTVLATEGSAPRGPGARMVVTADGVAGTIGGGTLEYQAVEQARAILSHAPGAWRVQDWPLGPLLGQCCGGRVRLLVEHLDCTDWVDRPALATIATNRIVRVPAREASPPPMPARGPLPGPGTIFLEPGDGPRLSLMLFGAGHVGEAIATRLDGLPVDLGWFDSRPEQDRDGVMVQGEDDLIACAGHTPEDSAVLILTHDHQLDYRLTAAALRSPARFIGLIGSATKRARFLSRLTAEGLDTTRLTCPIGIDGLSGKEPAVIAIAVIAQLLMLADPLASASSSGVPAHDRR